MSDFQYAKDVESVKRELAAMRVADQADFQSANFADTTRRHTLELKRLVKEYGCIRISQFGPHASHCAWLIAQHSDHDVAFQEHYLQLMLKAGDDVGSISVAFLTDRVRIAKGLRQIYGTQFDPKTATNLRPFPIVDVVHLEQRRARMGLIPFGEHISLVRQKYHLI